MSLLMAGDWNQMIFKVPSNPYYSMILYNTDCISKVPLKKRKPVNIGHLLTMLFYTFTAFNHLTTDQLD